MNKATMDKPHTFEDAKQYLAEGHHIDYEVAIPTEGYTSRGALMTRDEWLESVRDGSFIDYDGYGSMLTEEGKFIGGNIRPSSALKTLTLHPNTAYILWYNR